MPVRYSRAAIILHWSIAAAILFQISLGWKLDELGRSGFDLYQLHKSVGISILILSLVRLSIRLFTPQPPAVGSGAAHILARAVHVGFYIVMIAGPLSGWMLVSAASVKVPTLFFGILEIPHLPVTGMMGDVAKSAHSAIALIALVLLALHVAGAIRHHVLLRDGLVWRMVPGRSRWIMAGLILLVPLGVVLGRAVVPLMRSPAVEAESATQDSLTMAAEDASTNLSAPPDGDMAQEANSMATSEAEAAQNMAQAAAKPAPPPEWAIQSGGRLGFTIGSTDGPANGHFARWNGSVRLDPERPDNDPHIRIEVDLTSASVGDAYRDQMLANSDFFDSGVFPKAVFEARRVERRGTSGFRAHGTLRLKGVSAPQMVDFTLSGNGLSRQVAGKATVARQQFRIGMGDAAAGMDPKVAVAFSFQAHARKSDTR